MTCNIRFSWDRDGINSFPHRAGLLLELLDREAPDIVAFQEVTDRILAFLKAHLPQYTIIGHGRNQDRTGEGVFFAFRAPVELLELDTYWLSPTPRVPASRYDCQSHIPRICADAIFLVEGKRIRMIDLHLDHTNEQARLLAMEQVLQHVGATSAKGSDATILLGDLNAAPDGPTVAACRTAGYVDLAAEFPVTYHSYSGVVTEEEKAASAHPGAQNASKIDYIFMNRESALKVRTRTLHTDRSNGIYLSDHYPISVELV